ncbi:fibronectin type III domain-containing protein [Lacihabitans sp. LS3-19]|uniref:fibronectin type III domain-containing protein n=1 Tax=Lacihabitans sp. LS3-19 TaxID=2487335 RepID=UPI0020CD68C8|nr:fibronectin type III domain-containing protein [Lacihabitans sp. LS3-19]MCP9769581.1 fibronectin type III domain-containing protein [Lacihabitans sp. LS3-19]
MKYYLIIIFALISITTKSQLSLISFPKDNQLYPREENNTAKVSILGSYINSEAEKVVLQIFRNDSLKYTIDGPNENFDFNIFINAELSEYSFKLYYSKGNNLTLLKQANKILCGDVIVLYGQSNMVAGNGVDEFNATKSDKFMRNFDIVYGSNNQIIAENWYPAKSPYWGVGTIGNYLMLNFIDSLKIPFCVINGSVGGTGIDILSQRNDSNPKDPTFYYGKLLNRLYLSGLLDKVKYMAFLQGEAEAGNWYLSCNEYPGYFNNFIANVFDDIPSLKKFYEFQINIMKVGDGSNYVERAGYLRDFQRKTEEIYPDKITTLATVGTIPYDGVHFSDVAYQKLALDLSRLILRDLYGSLNINEIENPKVKYAYYNQTKTQITLVFQENQNVIYPADINYGDYTRSMRDFIYLTSDNTNVNYNQYNTPVINGTAFENTVTLNFAQPQTDLYITYLPASFSDFHSVTYNGPHISNGKGQRALSFYCMPILNAKPMENLIPNTPLNFAANGISQNQINISWNSNSSDDENYLIEISEDSLNFSLFTQIPSYQFSEQDINKLSNKKYFYRIKACNENGCSAFSQIVKAHTFKATKIDCPELLIKGILTKMNATFNSFFLKSSALIENSKIDFKALKSILLEPNFEFNPGNENPGVFTAQINGCE